MLQLFTYTKLLGTVSSIRNYYMTQKDNQLLKSKLVYPSVIFDVIHQRYIERGENRYTILSDESVNYVNRALWFRVEL